MTVSWRPGPHAAAAFPGTACIVDLFPAPERRTPNTEHRQSLTRSLEFMLQDRKDERRARKTPAATPSSPCAAQASSQPEDICNHGHNQIRSRLTCPDPETISITVANLTCTPPPGVYRRRDAASSAVVPNSHILSATLIVTPGGTIWSMRSSRSLGRTTPSAAR